MSAPRVDLTEYLAELRDRTPLAALIGQRVALKPSGRSWRGQCPFHGGKSASFSVTGQHYRCFSCGEHGDVIAYAMQTDGTPFRATVERLALDAGMAPPAWSTPADPQEAARLAREAEDRRARNEARQAERAREEARELALRIATARRLWAGSVPIDGTLAEHYLCVVRTIPTPDDGWPADVVRFHAASRSLILAGTNAPGAVQFVHRIYLTTKGENVLVRDGDKVRKKKITTGSMEGAVVRLPGDPHGPLQHAEGGETGLSAWVSTGHQTHLWIGSLANAQPPADRTNVVLQDDDKPDSPAAHVLDNAVARWRAAKLRIVLATPWAQRRGDKSDFNDLIRAGGPDAVRDRIAEAIAATPARPNCTMDELRTVMTTETEAWVRGDGPAILLNNASTSTGKGVTTLGLLAHLAKHRREERKRFVLDWRFSHLRCSAHKAAEAADAVGLRPLRILYAGDNHIVVAQHVKLARELGLIAAHDAGREQQYDPGEPLSPPRCTQPERAKQTSLAGEPVRLAACGIDLDGPHCIDRDECLDWRSIAECAHAEFVGTVAERVTSHHMPRHLRGFDFVLIDEPTDRVFRPEHDIMLDLLADHLFERHPVRDEKGEPDIEATELARAMYATVRFVINDMQNGYWPAAAMAAAGCDAAFYARFVELSDRRDLPTGMTAATPDHERVSLARTSFRNAARKLCAFGRLAGAIQAGEEGNGRMTIAGDAPRIAVMHPRAKLHPSLLDARIMVTGSGLELDRIARWLPGVQPMGVAGMLPDAPHQTLIHIHKAMGKGSMAHTARRRWARALITLEGEGATGVSVFKQYEHEFTGLPGVVAGHPGAMVGRKDWQDCTTFFGMSARFLSPLDAAGAGAAETGEEVPIKRPVRRERLIPMSDGRDVPVSVSEYEHPAAQTSLSGVRDFDVSQNQLGRPRAHNRTAANPVRTFDVGMHVPRGVLVDFLITSAEQYAPERFVMMAAEGLAVEHSVGRHRLHKAIYTQPWTGQNDKRLEAGGFVATALRVLCPPWRTGPRETWVTGRYWRAEHARREAGEMFISTQRQLAAHMQALREHEGATRIKVDRTIHAQPRVEELTINAQGREIPPVIVSPPEIGPLPAFMAALDAGNATRCTEKPPDR